MGIPSWEKAGEERQKSGDNETNRARAQEIFEDLAGKKDTVLGAVTGDPELQAKGTHSPLHFTLTAPYSHSIHCAGLDRQQKSKP
jgi:hypothetical protein